ncbi:MAG: oligosaccharide flippase family protein [Cytophagales bacterium]|uniref:oligosaccharide flippase family protein n=1 Tax=Cyclobacterium marinum TaxID=104 RepID=UPI0030DA527F|nr:oligosaccharide flippase family protein [Cytophagales bacterium]|tara:strand:- start:43529 stop:44842 length:1314 start_codon:yes stop_codon:yes gene_type:complete
MSDKPPFSFYHLLRHKSLLNLIFLFLIQSSNILVSIIAMPVLIRAVGVEEFGRINLAFSVILLVNVLVGFGYSLSAPKSVALNQGNLSALSAKVSEILWSKLFLAFISLIILGLLGFVFGFFEDFFLILWWSTVLLFSEATASVWFFQGKERLQWVSVINVFAKLTYLLLIIWCVQNANDSYLANFFLGLTAFAGNIGLLIFIHNGMKIRLIRPKFYTIIRSIKANFLLFLSSLASHIAINGGLIILSFFASAAVLGPYSIAERITMVLRMAPVLISQAVYPRASILYYEERKKFFSFLAKVEMATLAVGILIILGVQLTAPFIIQLIAGETLGNAVLFLKILSFIPLASGLNLGNMLMILVTEQKKVLFHSTWVFSVYMLVASFFLTEFYGGVGLAIALISTELIIFIVTTLLLNRKEPSNVSQFYRAVFSSHSYS